MVTFHNQIDIEASPEAVFDELSDVRHEQRWSDKLKSVELLTPEPIAVGSRCVPSGPAHPRTRSSTANSTAPAGGSPSRARGCSLSRCCFRSSRPRPARDSFHGTLKPRGPMRLLTPTLKKAFDKDVAENMRSAKAHVEQLARH